MNQGFREPEVATAARRGIVSRNRNLDRDPSALFRLGHSGGGLVGSTLLIQRRCRTGLTCRSGRLDPLQPVDLLDQRSLIGMRIHRRKRLHIEHVFECTRRRRQVHKFSCVGSLPGQVAPETPRAAGSMARESPLPTVASTTSRSARFVVDSCQTPINFRHRN